MVPQEELPILESMVNLKHRLTALKKDTTTFIRAKDVMSIYQSVAREVTKLNAVRDRANQTGMLSSSSAIDASSEIGDGGLGVGGETSALGSRAGSRTASGTGKLPTSKEGSEGHSKLRQGMAERSVSTESYASASSATISAGGEDGESSAEASTRSTPNSSRRPSALNTPNFDREELHGQLDALQRGHPGLSAARAGQSTSATASPSRSPQPLTSPGINAAPSPAFMLNQDHSSINPDEPTTAESEGETPTAEEEAKPVTAEIEEPRHLALVDVQPPTESNRVDQVLNDVFGLLSLFFLTIGKVRESPGTFCQIASMRQLLDHMNESGVYLQSDLQQFTSRLNVLKAIIKRDREEGKHPDAIIKLMMRKLEDTERLLQTLLKSLSVLSVELVPIHQRLVHIRRQLVALSATQLIVPKADIKPLVEELRKIDSSRVDGKFLGPGGSSVPTGQAILVGLLEDSFEICQDIRARDGEDHVAPPLKPIWERLTTIRQKLERLQLTHRWTLRETDLYNYSQALREVDAMRVDGAFVDLEGNKAEGQYVLLYLLRRCHGLIYRLIAESEPISEELMPIANKLSTVKKCLNEVLKYGGPFSTRDLYPYHLALHQIDSLRKDGKFLSDDGSIPEGQAILVAQLSEAHEILEMLKEGMDSEDEDDEDDEDEDEDEDDEEEEDEEEGGESATQAKLREGKERELELQRERERENANAYADKYGKRSGDRSEMQVTRQATLGDGVGLKDVTGGKSDLSGVVPQAGGEAAGANVGDARGEAVQPLERAVEGLKLASSSRRA